LLTPHHDSEPTGKQRNVTWSQRAMSEAYNDNLLRTLRLTREMLALADEGDRDRVDASCGIIYGILRDSAYRIRKLAEQECENHKNAGKWNGSSSCSAAPAEETKR